MKVLLLSAHFRPNIGGVETHLNDLVNFLVKKKWEVIVLTYKPLTTKVDTSIYQRNDRLTVIRIPWIRNLFYQFVSYPILEFIYLLPGLFFITPLVLIFKNPEIIHANGLVAGFVGVFWGKVFRKKIIISTHSIYNFPKNGLYRDFVSLTFKNSDFCLGLSEQATNEIKSLGISKTKIKKFTYWIDLNKFKAKGSKLKVKKKLGWNNEFVVLFVGRLISEKGIEVLLESVKDWDKNIKLKIIGAGPLEKKTKEIAAKFTSVDFIGAVDSDNLPIYYSGSDLLIVPSIHEEGFGRVILEALACGTPVIGSNRGAISEAMDDTVGKIININTESIKNTVQYYNKSRNELNKLAKNCRSFAERRYSEKNAETIVKSYQG